MPAENVDALVMVYYCDNGFHVTMRVFVNGALAGSLTVRTEEFSSFRELWEGAGFTPENDTDRDRLNG